MKLGWRIALILAACAMLPGCAVFHRQTKVAAYPPTPAPADVDCPNTTCAATISVAFKPDCKVNAPTVTVHAPNTTISWTISPAPARAIHFRNLSIASASVDFDDPKVSDGSISVLDHNTDGLKHSYMMYFDVDACDFDPIIVNKGNNSN
jgi:hypothetical protein